MAEVVLERCLCGESPEIGTSQHREQAREETANHLTAVEARNHSRGEAARDYERTKLAVHLLSVDHLEVSCPNCGRWVHSDTEEHAAAAWNKAITKLPALQPCCRKDYERRVDYDGMVLHVCTSAAHDESVHGRRYLPLEPRASYEIKPSDATR